MSKQVDKFLKELLESVQDVKSLTKKNMPELVAEIVRRGTNRAYLGLALGLAMALAMGVITYLILKLDLQDLQYLISVGTGVMTFIGLGIAGDNLDDLVYIKSAPKMYAIERLRELV